MRRFLSILLACAGVVALSFATGCEIDPFCIDCVEGDSGGDALPDGTPTDGDGDTDADTDSDGDGDADQDGDFQCDTEAEEICNGYDDDCDEEIDEGFDLNTDVRHCGRCNNPCIIPHAFNECMDGECVMDGCDSCFHDLDDDPENGCEYACCQVVAEPVEGSCAGGPDVDCCDGFDNDCDGELEEDHNTTNDPNNCGGCSASCTEGECPYACNFPFGISGCENSECYLAGCVEGHYDIDEDPANGCEYACSPNDDVGRQEVCNNHDDDCDGLVDNGIPGMGEPCGIDEGACQAGVMACIAGHEVCDGEIGPGVEVCDGEDNDCNEQTDESDPMIDAPCGTDMGECVRGSWICAGGELVCNNETPPTNESCNGLDDDCDGYIDNDVPDDGACGSGEGRCEPGRRECRRGRFQCVGAEGPFPEECNNLDDDCEGDTDEEEFNFDSNIRHCGGCDIDCQVRIPNALVSCQEGECHLDACMTGFYDFNDQPGCETPCEYRGVEECNNDDDDCNNAVDDWTPPSNFCGSHGVCAGVEPTCNGGVPNCPYPGDYEDDPAGDEELCDGRDNDCDGRVDDGFDIGPAFPCDNGESGRCFARGYYQCHPNGTTTRCVLTETPGTSMPEICNGIDDDCDTDIDEDMDFGDMNTLHVIQDVDLNGDGMIGSDESNWEYWIFQYEASHPDATGDAVGTVWSYACSQAPDPEGTYDPELDHEDGVLPWAAVSWRQAHEACCALNDQDDDPTISGCGYQEATASGGDSVPVPLGWGLCLAPDWQVACQVGRHRTDPDLAGRPWVYGYDSDSYDIDDCNGFDYGSGSAVPAGSLSTCSGGSSVFGDDHFDMSGNVHEWTYTGWYVCECDTNSNCQGGCPCDEDCPCGCDEDDPSDRGLGARCDLNDAGTGACACDPDCFTFYEYRGGSYENSYPGLTCQFDFNVGADQSDDPGGNDEPDPGLVLDSLGFRCCFYPAI